MHKTRAVCLNCMDGRVQLPVIEWVQGHYDVDYVDMITEPGMDGFLADENNEAEDVYRKVRISLDKNSARTIFIAGHHDCKGNPVSESVHRQQIQQAVERLKDEFKGIAVIGLWVNSAFKGENVGGE